MRAKHLAKILDDGVLAEIARLKSRPAVELSALGRSGETTSIAVGDQSFEITAWPEPASHDSDGRFVVLAGAWQKRWFGSTHHLRGFVVEPDGHYKDLAASELYHYD